MINESFHDLPVYRLPEEDYYVWRDQRVENFVKLASTVNPDPKYLDGVRTGHTEHMLKIYGPWRFNEIIGYVRLYFDGGQVLGGYFGPDKTRLFMTRKKVLNWQAWKLAPESEIPHGSTNAQILEIILQYVDDCRKELPRRYFDDTWLKTVGPFVDWNAVWKSTW